MIGAWSLAAFLFDLGTRLIILSEGSDRRVVGCMVYGALALLSTVAFGIMGLDAANITSSVLLPSSFFYLPLVIGFEAILRLLGVRGVSEFGPQQDAWRARRHRDEGEAATSPPG